MCVVYWKSKLAIFVQRPQCVLVLARYSSVGG
jgi:hypothetical protein